MRRRVRREDDGEKRRGRTEALSKTGLLGSFDVLAETLDGREDLSREVNLEVCEESQRRSKGEREGRRGKNAPIANVDPCLLTSSGLCAFAACAVLVVSPDAGLQKI